MILTGKIRLIIGLFAVGIVAYLVYFVATHGRIIITNPSDTVIGMTFVGNRDNTAAPITVTSGSFISSGSYIVRNDKSGQLRLAHVSVPRWLQAATVTFSDIQTAKIDRVAALTYENVFPASDGNMVSFTDLEGVVKGYTTHASSDAFGGKSQDTVLPVFLTSPLVLSSGNIAGITEEGVYQYSFQTKTSTPLAALDLDSHGGGTDLTPKLLRSSNVRSDLFGLYTQKDRALTIFSPTGIVSKHTGVNTGERGVVYDVNAAGVAIVKETSKEVIEGEGHPKLHFIVEIRTSAKKELDIGWAGTVSKVALSENGQFLAVLKDDYLWVYETSSGNVVMANLYSTANELYWNNSKLYTLSSDTGITVFSPANKQLLPINFNATGKLSFSKAAPFDSKFYVSAYHENQNTDLPDGYVIDLGSPSDGITESLVEHLPKKTNDYSINFLDSTIYIRHNYYASNDPEAAEKIASIQRAAQQWLKITIPSDILKRCKVVLVN